MVRWCWVNFQHWGVLLIWIRVGHGPTALTVGAGGGCLDVFSITYHFSFLSPSLWETARYRLKYCLKGPLSPKQPTNQIWYPRAIELKKLKKCIYVPPLKVTGTWFQCGSHWCWRRHDRFVLTISLEPVNGIPPNLSECIIGTNLRAD